MDSRTAVLNVLIDSAPNTVAMTDTWARSSEFGTIANCQCGYPATMVHIRKIVGAEGVEEMEVFCDECSPAVFLKPGSGLA